MSLLNLMQPLEVQFPHVFFLFIALWNSPTPLRRRWSRLFVVRREFEKCKNAAFVFFFSFLLFGFMKSVCTLTSEEKGRIQSDMTKTDDTRTKFPNILTGTINTSLLNRLRKLSHPHLPGDKFIHRKIRRTGPDTQDGVSQCQTYCVRETDCVSHRTITVSSNWQQYDT